MGLVTTVRLVLENLAMGRHKKFSALYNPFMAPLPAMPYGLPVFPDTRHPVSELEPVAAPTSSPAPTSPVKSTPLPKQPDQGPTAALPSSRSVSRREEPKATPSSTKTTVPIVATPVTPAAPTEGAVKVDEAPPQPDYDAMSPLQRIRAKDAALGRCVHVFPSMCLRVCVSLVCVRVF